MSTFFWKPQRRDRAIPNGGSTEQDIRSKVAGTNSLSLHRRNTAFATRLPRINLATRKS